MEDTNPASGHSKMPGTPTLAATSTATVGETIPFADVSTSSKHLSSLTGKALGLTVKIYGVENTGSKTEWQSVPWPKA